MILKTIAAWSALLLLPAAAAAARPCSAVDPPRNATHPAHNQQLLIPSGGVGMNALLFAAAGAGPHPTVILMHGLPGNERNLDLAQAIRRCGWDVLTFTYRGAWGSPGDFSISNAMEDTGAALAFARSPEGAKLGMDPKHIVLAGHSMGGATAFMTAAGAKGLDGLIILDAWNIAGEAGTDRAKLVAGLNDFGNSLHGATPETVADEILARGRNWDLPANAARLAKFPVLTVTAKYGGAGENKATTAALRAAGNRRATAIELATDHPYSDHRMELAATVTGWLRRLWVRR